MNRSRLKHNYYTIACVFTIAMITYVGYIGYRSLDEIGKGLGPSPVIEYDPTVHELNWTPQWSSNGEAVLVDIHFYNTDPVSIDGIYDLSIDGIYDLSIDGDELRYIVDGYSPSLSRDGRVTYGKYEDGGRIFDFWSDEEGHYVETVNRDGSDVKRVGKAGNRISNPVWSPDGSRIAFFADEHGLTIAKSDGSDVSRSNNFIKEWRGRWSNDGERVAALATRHENRSTHMLVNVSQDTTDTIVIAEESGDEPMISLPDWSPSDDRLYFARKDRTTPTWTTKMYSVNIDGSDLRVVSDLGEGFDVHEVAVSPDGAELLFVNRDISQEGYYGVYLMNTDGADLRNLTGSYDFTNDIASHGGGGSAPYVSWSPDGSRIAVFYRNDHPIIDGRRLVLFTMARDGSDIRALITGIPPQLGHGELLQPAEDPAVTE